MAAAGVNISGSGLSATAVVTSVPAAGIYQVQVTQSNPTLNTGASADSQVVTTIKQNSTTVYTSNAGDQGAACTVNMGATDTLTFGFASSTGVDQGANTIKYNISIG